MAKARAVATDWYVWYITATGEATWQGHGPLKEPPPADQTQKHYPSGRPAGDWDAPTRDYVVKTGRTSIPIDVWMRRMDPAERDAINNAPDSNAACRQFRHWLHLECVITRLGWVQVGAGAGITNGKVDALQADGKISAATANALKDPNVRGSENF